MVLHGKEREIMKYEITDITMIFLGRTLHRIKALENFDGVKAGDLGGWIEKEDNLSQEGLAWVFDDARVFGDARVERLQHITIGGTSEEGTPRPTDEDWLSREDWEPPAPFCWFARMWDSAIKKADLPRYGWEANPWVWVIQFERISKEEAFANA